MHFVELRLVQLPDSFRHYSDGDTAIVAEHLATSEDDAAAVRSSLLHNVE
jgi:hypothetical protein